MPRIKISPKISKTLDSSNGKYKYRVKIFNAGHRDAYEFSIKAEIRFPQKNETSPGNTQLMQIGINTVPLSYLGVKKGRTMNLKTELIPIEHQRHLSEELRERIQCGERVLLEEILEYLGRNAVVKVYVMCNDGVSGARKYFVSPEYTIRDITDRRFDPKSEKIQADGVT